MNRILLMVFRNILQVPSMWWKLCRYAKHPERYSELQKWRHIQWILLRAIRTGNIDLKVSGLEYIPEKNGFLVYANHQGMFDILAIAATCDNPMGAVMKKELANIPFLKQIRLCTKSFPMDRENLRQSMEVIMNVTKEVKNGRNYLIFPEGTRSKLGNELLDFHSGSFKCALKARCPIVPVALIDCFKVLDEKGCKPVMVQIHYLRPIPYEEYKDMNTSELAALVKGRIESVIRELTEPKYTDEY